MMFYSLLPKGSARAMLLLIGTLGADSAKTDSTRIHCQLCRTGEDCEIDAKNWCLVPSLSSNGQKITKLKVSCTKEDRSNCILCGEIRNEQFVYHRLERKYATSENVNDFFSLGLCKKCEGSDECTFSGKPDNSVITIDELNAYEVKDDFVETWISCWKLNEKKADKEPLLEATITSFDNSKWKKGLRGLGKKGVLMGMGGYQDCQRCSGDGWSVKGAGGWGVTFLTLGFGALCPKTWRCNMCNGYCVEKEDLAKSIMMDNNEYGFQGRRLASLSTSDSCRLQKRLIKVLKKPNVE